MAIADSYDKEKEKTEKMNLSRKYCNLGRILEHCVELGKTELKRKGYIDIH
jgi:hypothetical protein